MAFVSATPEQLGGSVRRTVCANGFADGGPATGIAVPLAKAAEALQDASPMYEYMYSTVAPRPQQSEVALRPTALRWTPSSTPNRKSVLVRAWTRTKYRPRHGLFAAELLRTIRETAVCKPASSARPTVEPGAVAEETCRCWQEEADRPGAALEATGARRRYLLPGRHQYGSTSTRAVNGTRQRQCVVTQRDNGPDAGYSTAGSSSAECPGEARGTIEAIAAGSTSTVPSSSRRLARPGEAWRRYCAVPVPGRANRTQRRPLGWAAAPGTAVREPTPGVANPQSGLTAKGCLAAQTPLPLARTRPRGPGQHWQGTCTGWASGTSYAPATVPSTVRVHVAAQVLKSTVPSTVTNWQRSVPHPELVLVHSEP
ncbi:hypothetical protein TrVFT333_011099 [Trichoderma virens FT-333]|nr:hypothetical protein TrVFT333_011099 [Trichoderma virens FT-333]